MNFYRELHREQLEQAAVCYMRRTGPYGRENFALMARFRDWLRAHDLYGDDAVILAIPLDNPNVTQASGCRYDVCAVMAADRISISDAVKTSWLEGGQYAVFLLDHSAEAIQRDWAACFSEPEKQSCPLDSSRPIMECYVKSLVERRLCELCVPILS